MARTVVWKSQACRWQCLDNGPMSLGLDTRILAEQIAAFLKASAS
jgi:hypothetical protein